MKKTLIALAAASTLLLAGCAGDGSSSKEYVEVHYVTLKDGRQVQCVTIGDYGGISCDFASAK